jgi:hypothetical protein
MFFNILVRHPYILIHSYILPIRLYIICIPIPNPLVAFDLFLYLYLDLISIEEELKGIGGFRLRYRIGRIRGAFNPFYLGNLSSLVYLA